MKSIHKQIEFTLRRLRFVDIELILLLTLLFCNSFKTASAAETATQVSSSFSDKISAFEAEIKAWLGKWLKENKTEKVSSDPSKASASNPPLGTVSANAEFLQEIFRITIIPDSIDVNEFKGWLNAFDQGASIEGIVRGIVQSDGYHRQELNSKFTPIHSRALDYAVTEISRMIALTGSSAILSDRFEMIALKRNAGDSGTGNPIATLPTGDDGKKSNMQAINMDERPLQHQSAAPVPSELDLIPKLRSAYFTKNFFEVKRILTDQTLIFLEKQAESRSKLAQWYVEFVGRTNEAYPIAMGASMRSSKDMAFHQKFAIQAPYDRLIWEVLNRHHRIMNALELEGSP